MKRQSVFDYINGTPIPAEQAAEIQKVMESVVPEIVEAVKRREHLAATYGVRTVVQEEIKAQRDAADTWYAQYMAWVKRGTEAELREIELTARLATQDRVIAELRKGLEHYAKMPDTQLFINGGNLKVEIHGLTTHAQATLQATAEIENEGKI